MAIGRQFLYRRAPVGQEPFSVRPGFVLALGVCVSIATVQSLSAGSVRAVAGAAFPGPNGKIAFTSDRDGNREIYVMNPDGTGQTNLTNNAAADTLPAWSPDGSKIAFVSDRNGNEEIYTMNADGSNVVRLTNHGAIDRYPAWSPDGTQIAFGSLRDFPWKIFVMDATDTDADGNGDNLVRLTHIGASDLLPAWSPDGTRIAFVSDRTGFAQVFVMDAADGSNQVRLTNNTVQNQVPNWSPDGSQIAFATTRDGNFEIYVMDAVDSDADGNGDNPTRLTNNPANDYDPSWSPDGSSIVFQSDRAGAQELFIMSADGSGQTNASGNPADDFEPDWGVSPVIQIRIDIKPGSFPNSINPRSRGRIPVAIITTPAFDAATVDWSTVRFGGDGTTAAPAHVALEDVDGDSDLDMILHFHTQQTQIVCGDTSASLAGATFGGQSIEGSDSVNTVGCK